MRKLLSIIGDTGVRIKREENRGVIEYEAGEMEVRIGLTFFDGGYVAYNQITGKMAGSDVIASASRSEWLRALGAVRVLQSDKMWPMMIEGDGIDLTLTNKESTDSVGNAVEVIEGGGVGVKFRIYMNLGFVEAGIREMKEGEIELRRFAVSDKVKMFYFTDGELSYLVA